MPCRSATARAMRPSLLFYVAREETNFGDKTDDMCIILGVTKDQSKNQRVPALCLRDNNPTQ